MIFDEKYLQLCSEKTLQADENGFFLQFVERVVVNVGEKWIKEVFGNLKSDKERIKKIYEDDKVKHDVINFLSNVQEIYRKKCPQTAKRRLLEAESVLKTGDKKKALSLYSQTILKAPKLDPALGTALLSRAKILISMNEYSTALTDLQLSLQEKIPNQLKFEVFWMMAICYKALNDETKSKVSLNLAEKLANDKVRSALRHSMTITYQPIKKPDRRIPPISGDRHAHLSHASKKITVKKSDEMGTYVVANEEIKTGETLVVEEAKVACLLPEKFGTHCHHCFDRFLAAVGCPDCAGVAFCSPKCRDDAIFTYHKYECKFLDLLIGSGMSVLSLAALRTVTQKKVFENKTDDEMYRLCTNSTKRSSGDFLQRTLMAAFLLRCLQHGGYFTRNGAAVIPTDEEYQVGEVLLHNLQVLQFNAHEIYETLYTTEHRLKGGRPANIGVAVFPTVSLFNHGCHPSVIRYFVGKHIVITSLHPLNPGDLIAENYGPIFTHRTLTERQRSLSCRYWFNCKCQACLENWPLLNKTSEFVRRVRCETQGCDQLFAGSETEETKCPKCEKSVNLGELVKRLEWCEEQYEAGAKCVEKKKIEEAIKVLSGALDEFYRVSAPPHRETHLAEDSLRVCFTDFGNTCECLVKKGPN